MAKPHARSQYVRKDVIDTIITRHFKEYKSWFELQDEIILKHKMTLDCARQIIMDAKKQVKTDTYNLFSEDLQEDIQRLEYNYDDAISNGDKRLALDILKEINKMKGHMVERIDMKAQIESGPIEIIFGGKKDDNTD